MCHKVGHRTRLAALDQMKAVIWRNASRGDKERSKGLNVYRCPACTKWHVGHHAKEKEPSDRCR